MIFYFSCTGNTRWAAKQISMATGEPLSDISCLPCNGYEAVLADGESIGFCFPVHAWRPPVVVREWVSHLRVIAKVKPFCWLMLTAGDDIGETVECFESDLHRATGLNVDSAFSLQMPESYVGLPFMDVDSREREREKIAAAEKAVADYAQLIVQKRRGQRPLHLSHWPRINSRFLGALFVRCLLTDKPFRVDPARCNGCGMCAKVCPVGNITVDGQPHWNHSGRCISCFACYHHCHARAIEYGRRTKGKGQYFFGKNQTNK